MRESAGGCGGSKWTPRTARLHLSRARSCWTLARAGAAKAATVNRTRGARYAARGGSVSVSTRQFKTRLRRSTRTARQNGPHATAGCWWLAQRITVTLEALCLFAPGNVREETIELRLDYLVTLADS